MIACLNRLAQWLLPNYCLLCQAKTNSTLALCEQCVQAELPWHNGPQCKICAVALTTGDICGHCLAKPPAFDRVIAPFEYKFPVDLFMPKLKFGKKLIYAHLLANLLAKHLIEYTENLSVDTLIPIPLHCKRLQERGFNQSLEIAKILQKKTQIPLVTGLLKRHQQTQPQAQLNAKARANNVKNAFSVTKTITYQHIALVDDVITTTSTVREASKLLKKQGVKTIVIYCLARATKR